MAAGEWMFKKLPDCPRLITNRITRSEQASYSRCLISRFNFLQRSPNITDYFVIRACPTLGYIGRLSFEFGPDFR